MRTAAMSVILLALMAGSSEAQGNGRYGRNQGVPPGRQPRATSCDQAERLASRDRNARVIYGPSTYRDRSYGGVYPNDRAYGNTYPSSNGRYGNNKPTLVTSNLPPTGGKKSIEGFLGQSAYDRLFRNGCTVVEFDWCSYTSRGKA